MPYLKDSTSRFGNQPIYTLLILSLILVTLIPVLFLMLHLYHAAWDNAWREINEKHRLLALNLANPIKIYVEDHRSMLGKLALDIANAEEKSLKEKHNGLMDALLFMDGFRSISLVSKTGRSLLLAHSERKLGKDESPYQDDQCYQQTRDTHIWCLSDIRLGPVSQQPTIIMTQAIPTEGTGTSDVLVAELEIGLIEQLRQNIRFGKKGHSAIVDRRGHVIAHPNPAWMESMHDLSHLSIVKKMMRGETGATQFYSPFVKQEMVAGYTSVPEIGWGIMVPQPRSEVEQQVSRLMQSHTPWIFAGIALAILLGLILVRWITRPLNRLVTATDALLKTNFSTDLPPLSPYAPRETVKLYRAMNTLLEGFRKTQAENRAINDNLQQRIDDATSKLLESNSRLERLALCDHLTTLPNRRQFESVLRNSLNRRSSDQPDICLMLIDIDYFKNINDCYGHAAGDLVIREIATILNGAMRLGDLVARYGGDEFAAELHCDIDTCRTRAEQIRQEIEHTVFDWNGTHITATVSIGLVQCRPDEETNIGVLLHEADSSMYEAKKSGRNRIHIIAPDHPA